MARKKSDGTETAMAEEPAVEMTAAARLRAFEDDRLGADVTRYEGRVERGHGSLFNRMSDEDKAAHAELEQAAEAEAHGG